MSQTQTQTKLLPPFTAVRLTWALTGQFPKGPESQNIYALADKVLRDIQGQAKGGPEQEYVDSTVAIIMAGMRTLYTIYKGRELNFGENEKLRSVALYNARENLEFGKKAQDFIKSLPVMTVTTGTGVITASVLGMEPLQLWMLGMNGHQDLGLDFVYHFLYFWTRRVTASVNLVWLPVVLGVYFEVL